MPPSPGTMLGPYRLIEEIGAGSMGAVWRAHDTRLSRDVAVKFVLPALVADPEHLTRFEREARVLAALNHPNIAAIYGLESYEEGKVRTPTLVLELVPGEPLSDLVDRGPVPVARVMDLARQILDGLAAAHAAGVVHRDLKPGNVRVTPDGRAKIVDFGLARAAGPVEADSSSSPTLTSSTLLGTLLGTPAYMSPEQARGLPADARTDLWAFGCIVFELLMARRAFAGGTISDTIASVLTSDPALDELPAGVFPEVIDALRSCLVKDVERRDVTASGLRAAFGERASVDALRPRLTQETFGEGVDGFPAWSPDGTELVYAAETGRVRKLVRTRLGSGSGAQLTHGDADDIMPTWSPDGKAILFVRARKTGQRLEPGDVFGEYVDADVWALDLASGRQTRWVERAFNPSYAPDGGTVAVDASWAGPRRIFLLDPRGRNPLQASSDVSEAVSHMRPRFSPDGKAIVFQILERTRFNVGIVDVASRKTTRLTNEIWSDLHPVWSPSGRFVYFSSFRSGGLNVWRLPVSASGGVRGVPEQITNGAGQDVEIAVAPGGRRLAFTILKQNNALWVLPVSADTGRPTGAPRRLMATSRDDSRGAWSPDGRAIAFNSARGGDMNLWLHRLADGETRALVHGPGGDYQPTWSPDGKRLTFFSSRRGCPGIWTLELPSGELACLSSGTGVEINPFYSPNGQLIAYQSDRDGRLEVWVMGADGSEARQLTRCGVSGHFLRWTSDGDHVVFRCPGSGATLRVSLDGGEPEPMGTIAGGAHMSLSPDGAKIMDVVAHKTLWVSTIGVNAAEAIFEFDDPDVRIDYPVWSPDGTQVVFDRFRPQGGEVWILDGLE